jgi:hypothetical protein
MLSATKAKHAQINQQEVKPGLWAQHHTQQSHLLLKAANKPAKSTRTLPTMGTHLNPDLKRQALRDDSLNQATPSPEAQRLKPHTSCLRRFSGLLDIKHRQAWAGWNRRQTANHNVR